MNEELMTIYRKLFNHFGPQNWWPGEGLEIAIGAILTQQTSWKNVEKALDNLKEVNCLTIRCLQEIELDELERLIKPSGYYRVKARRIKNFIAFISKESKPSRDNMIAVNGLGPETTDSILLYQYKEPIFVIDAYTFRILRRVGVYIKNSYSELQRIFMDSIPRDVQLYKEYHALIVRHAKEYCLKTNPKCSFCPLMDMCLYPKDTTKQTKRVQDVSNRKTGKNAFW